ncbi:MAG: hypothetical protein OEZ34_01475 [Spirochaetia bacterium]|nr:hypothetical protein [Spirochaetia bacterium]
MMKRILKGTFLTFSVFFTGCFEYHESLFFLPDYSGYADIRYTVPIYKDEDRSMLAYLPVDQNKIIEKYDRYLSSDQYRIENYKFDRIKTDLSEDQGEVAYRVFFSDPRSLEYLLIGKNKIYRNGGRLYLHRKFSATASPREEASRISNNLYTKVLQSFNNKKLTFQIVFPWYYDLVTNLGNFSRPGLHNFTLPLENTFNTEKPIVWKIELKANPVPEAGF